MFRKVTALLVLLAAIAAFAAAASPASAQPTAYWVSEYGVDAKLAAKYDYVSCHGLRRYGTHALNTIQWGWVPGYFEFDCAYDTEYRSCYNGRFETDLGKYQWYVRMLSPGRCYAR